MKYKNGFLYFISLSIFFLYTLPLFAESPQGESSPPYPSQQNILFSHYDGYAINLSLEGTLLTLSGLPKNYNSIWIKIIRISDGVEVKSQILSSKKQRLHLNFKKLPEGEYFLNLLFTTLPSTTYKYFSKDDLHLLVSKGGLSLRQSPAYCSNLTLYNEVVNPLDYLGATPVIQSDAPVIINLSHTLTKDLSDDYSKILAIHNWVSSHITYNYDSFYKRQVEPGSMYPTTVLETKKAICTGYTNLTAALIRASGIPCRIVEGYALGIDTDIKWQKEFLTTTISNHTWNEAYVNGRWIIIDTTWDSGKRGLRYHRYFDTTLEMFSMDHKIIKYL